MQVVSWQQTITWWQQYEHLHGTCTHQTLIKRKGKETYKLKCKVLALCQTTVALQTSQSAKVGVGESGRNDNRIFGEIMYSAIKSHRDTQNKSQGIHNGKDVGILLFTRHIARTQAISAATKRSERSRRSATTFGNIIANKTLSPTQYHIEIALSALQQQQRAPVQAICVTYRQETRTKMRQLFSVIIAH